MQNNLIELWFNQNLNMPQTLYLKVLKNKTSGCPNKTIHCTYINNILMQNVWKYMFILFICLFG